MLPLMELVFPLDDSENRPGVLFEFNAGLVVEDPYDFPPGSSPAQLKALARAREASSRRLPRRARVDFPHGRAGEDLLSRLQSAPPGLTPDGAPCADRHGGGPSSDDSLIAEDPLRTNPPATRMRDGAADRARPRTSRSPSTGMCCLVPPPPPGALAESELLE